MLLVPLSLLASSALAARPVTNASDTAVVVGIEDYAFLPDVPYADNDAKAFASWLTERRRIPADRVQVVKSASKEKILDAVQRAAALSGTSGVVWVYFAGHGAASPTTGRRMLLGVDAMPDANTFDARGVLLDEVVSVAQARGSKVMIVADACYSGVGRTGESLDSGGKRPAFSVREADETPDAWSWLAADAGEMAGPIDAVEHGAFTWFTLAALSGAADGAADDRKDDKIVPAELKAWVTKSLREQGTWDQTPQWRGSVGEWPLVEGVKYQGAPKIPSTAPETKRTAPLEMFVSLSADTQANGWNPVAMDANANEIAMPTCSRFALKVRPSEAVYVQMAYAVPGSKGSLGLLWPEPKAAPFRIESGSTQVLPGGTGGYDDLIYLEPPRSAVEDVFVFASATPLETTSLSRLSRSPSSVAAASEDELTETFRAIALGSSARMGGNDARVTAKHGSVLVYHLRITHQKGAAECPKDWKR